MILIVAGIVVFASSAFFRRDNSVVPCMSAFDLAGMRIYVPQPDQMVYNANMKMLYKYNASSTATEALPWVIQPTGITTGRYELVVSVKREEVYSGVTNASGDYVVTFGKAFAAVPNIQANIVGGTDLQRNTQTVTTTGFTVHAVQQNTTTVALVGLVLVPGTSVVVGAAIHVSIIEQP